MVSLGVLYLLFFICLSTAYKIVVKTFKDKLIIFFWATCFLYLGYLGYAFILESFFKQHSDPFRELLFKYTFVNIPFYMGIALTSVLTLVIFAYLLEHYDLSLVSPILKVNMLITTAGYLIFGQPFYLYPFLGVIIAFFGAVVSVWPSPVPKKLVDFKKRFPFSLLGLAIVAACLKSISKILIYLVIQKTPVTLKLQTLINHFSSSSHALDLTFVHPFEYNVGVRFFITVFFLIYIVFIKKLGKKSLIVLRQHFWKIIGVSSILLAETVIYFTAYGIIQDKIIISPVTKLSLPLILIMAHFILNEKITRQKVIGYTIIILGSSVALL